MVAAVLVQAGVNAIADFDGQSDGFAKGRPVARPHTATHSNG
jgi:hypothetical protein